MTLLMSYSRLFWLSVLLMSVGMPGVCQAGETGEETVPIWRFWSPGTGSHFYTASESEKDKLVADYNDVWVYEKIAFRAFDQQSEPNLVPVYRFWSKSLERHLYTLDRGERDELMAEGDGDWIDEGVAFYVYPPGQEPVGTIAVHRYWAQEVGESLYTASQKEGFTLVSLYPDDWEHLGVAWYAYSVNDPSIATIIKGPYLQSVTQDAVTIMWETDVPADSAVEYDIDRATSEVQFDPELVTLHKMCITGLGPETVGAYRVISGTTASDFGSFATAPIEDRSFRFAVYGDTRIYSGVHAEVVQGIIDSGPEIVFHVGDLVHQGRDYRGWGPEFFDPVGPLLQNTPVIPILGNHEYSGNGPIWFYYLFDRPLNEGWFAMTYGDVRFVGLDTNVGFGSGRRQHDWLLQELSSPEYQAATWHVVMFHHPAFTATVSYSDDSDVVSHLVPLLEANDVDIVFQGHSHTYERYFYHGVCYIVTGGGSGPLYPLVEDTEPPIRQFGLTVNHHCTVDIDTVDKLLTLRAVDIDGQMFDTIELKKAR